MKQQYKKVNKSPIEIHYIPDEDPRYEMQPSFVFNGQRYWLKDFIRTHNNIWVNQSDFPDYIDAYQGNEYMLPLYIHYYESEQQVDVYIKI